MQAVVIIGLSIFLALLVTKKSDHSISITVKESGYKYKLSASYNAGESRQVSQYIDDYLEQEPIFKNSTELDSRILLDDGTNFYIKAAPGRFLLIADKRDNSAHSLQKIRHITEVMKKAIAASGPSNPNVNN